MHYDIPAKIVGVAHHAPYWRHLHLAYLNVTRALAGDGTRAEGKFSTAS